MPRALLLDLDETLMPDQASNMAAFAATAGAAVNCYGTLDGPTLATAAQARARQLWRAAPSHTYCMGIGISPSEGLWSRFEGEDADTRSLRVLSVNYRRETWRFALAEQDVADSQLADELAERFGTERRARCEVFADAHSSLSDLARSYALGIVTNGAGCLQREKLAASGLQDYFDVVVVSGEFGAGKPEASIFRHAMAQLDSEPDRTVMIGDSLPRDIDGATAAGLGAIWVNRTGRRRARRHAGVVEIAALTDLRTALDVVV